MQKHTPKQMAAILIKLREDGESAREAWIPRISSESEARKWTAMQLQPGGEGNAYLTEVLTIYHGKEPSSSELSKFRSVAHPDCRGQVDKIFDSAKKIGPTYGQFRDNVALKMMSKIKNGKCKTLEEAEALAIKDYEDQKQKKAEAPKAGSPEGILLRLNNVADGAPIKKVFTEESINLLKLAIKGLEPLQVEEPKAEDVSSLETEEAAPEVADIAKALSGFTPEAVNGLTTVLAALVAAQK